MRGPFLQRQARQLLFLLLLSAFAGAATVTIDSVSFNPSTFVEDQTVTLSVVTKETSSSGNASVTLSVSLSSGLQFADTGLATASKTYTISSGQTSTQTFQVKAVGSGSQTITTTLSSTATIQNGNDIETVCAQPKSCVLSLSASSDDFSVTAGDTFTISGTVTSCICNYPSANTQVTLSASAPSLVSFSSATKSLGSVTTSSSANWLVTGVSAGDVTFTLTASADSPTVSDSKQVSVTVTSSGGNNPGGNTPGGGGSSGGAAAATEGVKETKSVASISPDSPASVSFSKAELSVSEVRLEVSVPVINVSVSVEKLDSKPSSITTAPVADGKVYKYLSISSTVPSANLSKVKIKFKVENKWISSNNYSTSTISLNRYATSWSKLPTKFLSSDTNNSYFEAESPGFSTFAITGEKPAAAPVQQAPAEQPKPQEETPLPITPTPTGLTPTVSLVSQSDIDTVRSSLNSVVPQTERAKLLLEQARAKLTQAQNDLNANPARAKQLVDEARLLVQEAAGLRSAAIAKEKTSIFTVLLILVVLIVGTYAYYTRPPPREGSDELAKLRKERDTIVQMKKNAEKEYLSRKIDQDSYKSMLSDYESRLIEVNTRIDALSKRNN